jgi:hypothetical protein
MKRLGMFSVLFFIASAAFAQVTRTSAPVSFGFSNSVVDLNGNVLIFDESFSGLGTATPTSLTEQTHVIVVSSDGKNVNGYNYNGSFAVLGVGQNAVYALVTTFTLASTTSAGTTTTTPVYTRQLVALHVQGGALTPSTNLPLINVASNQDVRLSLAVGVGQPDTIALISGNSVILPPILGIASPVAGTPHMVSLYTYNGGTAFTLTAGPISTAGK